MIKRLEQVKKEFGVLSGLSSIINSMVGPQQINNANIPDAMKKEFNEAMLEFNHAIANIDNGRMEKAVDRLKALKSKYPANEKEIKSLSWWDKLKNII